MRKNAPTDTSLTKAPTVAIDRFSEGFSDYLTGLSLPTAGVLVPAGERAKVLISAPSLVALIELSERANAMYVSKFIAACGAGLFDAALNFIWDEVVVRLRGRVTRFDLAYFYDTAVPPPERQDYQTEEDLRDLSDAALIKGALKCGMLTDIGYKHLDYIREMRNWASAAHPNHASLTGFQLVAWFETCLKEVILREPEGEVLEVGRLLSNLRTQGIGTGDVPAIAASVRKLPTPLAAALLRSVAGLYCDPRQDVRIRDNVKLVARCIWAIAAEGSRGEIGLKYANYAANADVDRKRLAHEFLELVDGLTYLPESELALELQSRVTQLEAAHDGWDNFHNEPAAARQLAKYIPETGKMPSQVNDEYVRVVVRCRVGRTSGISRNAVSTYDALIELFEEHQIRATIQTLQNAEVASRLGDPGCFSRFQAIITRLQAKTVNQSMKRVLARIGAATPAQLPGLWQDTSFQRNVRAM